MKKMSKKTLSERIVSKKRHTIGYVIGSKEYTRREVVGLARQNKIKNVKVVDKRHLVGDGVRLYDLPTRFAEHKRFASLMAK